MSKRKTLPDLWALRDPKTGDYIRYEGGMTDCEVIIYSGKEQKAPGRHGYSKAYKWVRLRPEVEP